MQSCIILSAPVLLLGMKATARPLALPSVLTSHVDLLPWTERGLPIVGRPCVTIDVRISIAVSDQ